MSRVFIRQFRVFLVYLFTPFLQLSLPVSAFSYLASLFLLFPDFFFLFPTYLSKIWQKKERNCTSSFFFQGSDGYTHTSSFIRTPYYSTENGYSYGPYQVTQGYSSHNSYPKNQITQYKYSNPSHQYQNNFRNHYKPKPKQPDNLTAIKSKSYATSKPIVQNYQTFATQPVKTPQSALGIPRRTYGYQPIIQCENLMSFISKRKNNQLNQFSIWNLKSCLFFSIP